MTVRISGVLKDGTGKAVPGCTIELKARRTTETVIVTTVAYGQPGETGSYSMDVEPGLYRVTLNTEGYAPSYVGDILVKADSAPGTLNKFLMDLEDAQYYPKALAELERNTGKQYDRLYIVGGGAKNDLLNRLTAQATGKRVIALPIEATALGNLKIQMEADL